MEKLKRNYAEPLVIDRLARLHSHQSSLTKSYWKTLKSGCFLKNSFAVKNQNRFTIKMIIFPLANQSWGPMVQPLAVPLPLVVPAQGSDQNGCSYNGTNKGRIG